MPFRLTPPPGVSLRPAQADDYRFAETLYLDGTRPLLQALGRWDEAAVISRFSQSFQRHPAKVICADGADIGWLQISRSAESIHLHQVHLCASYRNRGIGSHLIRGIMERARDAGLPMTLNVIRGNPAIALYLRLGFKVVSQDAELIRMRWEAAPLSEG
jgi:GNAT superfamily N-acetyltransferase